MKMSARGALSRSWFWALLLGASALPAWALPVVVNDPYHYLVNNSTNTLGIAPGLRQLVGAQTVVPNGGAGTTAVAVQNGVTRELPWFGTTTFNDEFSLGMAADPALYGAWTLHFRNGSNETTVQTPSITATSPMPFVRSAHLDGRRVSWTLPDDNRIDAVRINVRDHGGNLAGTGSDVVYNRTFARGTTSVLLPATLNNGLPLDGTHRYTVEISLIDSTTNLATFQQAQILNRSRLYVDFTPTTRPVYLPVVDPGPQGLWPVFHFDIASVLAGATYSLDPAVATGYDYAIGAGNPNFRSVLLPAGVGDNLYTVFAGGHRFDVAGGVLLDFGSAGVSSFSVRGIEASAALNPFDATAFVTDVSFTAAGEFTGTMTPVPEAPTSVLMLAGLPWLVRRARRRSGRPGAA